MISLIIPVYNEAESLPHLFDEVLPVMESLGKEYEIVCINDGSRDESREILRNIAKQNQHVRVLRFEKNHGQTAAFDAGFRAARGDIVITMDADLQNDPRNIPALLKAIETSDVACGWRWQRNDPFIKRISSKIANRVRNRLNRETVPDTGCSLKAFRKEVVDKFKLYNGMHRFFPTLAKMEGHTVQMVKVNHRHRKLGKSKYGIWNRIFRALHDALAVRWMQSRVLKYQVEEETP